MHSLIGTVFVIAIAVAFLIIFKPKYSPFPNAGRPHPASLATILLATLLAALVHLLTDLAGSSGIMLLWPFRTTRFAWDFLPFLDPWILMLLGAGILLPEFLGLVGSEIGVREKAPRGRNGAIVALALGLIYVGARATLHGNAVAQLDAHSYRGESPRRIAAFPNTVSPMNWHGIVETTGQICTTDVPLTGSARFDPEAAVCLHKPDESPLLTAALETTAAKEFLQVARFPKASVNPAEGGSEVVLRDVRDAAQNEALHAIAAQILLDLNGKVTSQKIVWARHVLLR